MLSILSVCNSVCPRGGACGHTWTFQTFCLGPSAGLPRTCLGSGRFFLRLKGPLFPLCEHCRNALLRWLSRNRCSMKHLNVSAEWWFASLCQVVPGECSQARWAAIVRFSIILGGIYEKHCGLCFCDITIVISCIITGNSSSRRYNCLPCEGNIWQKRISFIRIAWSTKEMLIVFRKFCVFFSTLKACNVMHWPWGAAISVRVLTSTLCALWISVMLK